MVIAVLGGSRWNAAGLSFVAGTAGETEIVIGLDWLTYQSMEKADKVVPYAFLVVPRSGKAIRIQFDDRDLGERVKNAPPKWRDCHTFPKISLPK